MRLQITDMTLHRLDLPVPGFRTAHGAFDGRPVVLVRLVGRCDGARVVGWGEAAPLPAWGTESIDEVRAALGSLILPLGPIDLREIGEAFPRLEGAPAARFALESACLDAAARAAGVPLAEWLGGGAEHVAVNGTLGAETGPEEAVELVEQGFPAVKLKLGTGDWRADLKRTRAVRDSLPAEIDLRVDANGSWSVHDAGRYLEGVGGMGVDYVEQPVAREEREGLAELARTAPVAVAADESAHPLVAARQLVERGDVPVLVLKPMALGSLVGARGLAVEAAKRGMRVVWTSSIESAVGRSAVAHLAASLMSRGKGGGRPGWPAHEPDLGRSGYDGEGGGRPGWPAHEPDLGRSGYDGEGGGRPGWPAHEPDLGRSGYDREGGGRPGWPADEPDLGRSGYDGEGVPALDRLTGPHGLATGAMLEADVVSNADPVADGLLTLRDGPGLGVTPDEAALARLAPEGGRR